MTDIEFQHTNMVRALVKPGDDILKTLTSDTVDLWHAGTGVSGEAGELLDAIKKVVVYCKPIDLENITEELGDLEFYMEQVRQRTGITREQSLQHNMNKLAVRYGKYKYTDQAAHDRADKKGPCGSFEWNKSDGICLNCGKPREQHRIPV